MSALGRRGGLWLGVAGVLLLLLVLGLLRGRTRNAALAAFPLVDGVLPVSGISAGVAIDRDARGIPRVQAATEEDAWFGLGFAHAQDRLAQMCWLRRLARGRSAEILGREGLPADRLARTLDLAGIAASEAEGLRAGTRRWLQAYADGVNARIARVRSGAVAAPLVQLGPEQAPEDWSVADSLAVLKLHAWNLSGSLDASLVLQDLLARLGGVEARPFFPEPRGDETWPDSEPMIRARLWRDPLRRAAGLEGASAGSTAFVVGGRHTRSGLPMLVADAHLEPTAPPLLYLAGLAGGELDVAGATLPGVPAVWTGHNQRVAWASTHAKASVTDLYLEMVDPDGAPRYHDGRGWKPLEERVERIAVRGGDEEVLTVRSTRHGPLLDGLQTGHPEPLALAWVGQRGRGGETLEALRGAARAGDATALLRALAGVQEPALAVVYADVEGAAGMQVVGWIPRRPLATDLVPVPGRARWYDWEGPVAADELPGERIADGRGWAIAADNRLARSGASSGEWLWRHGVRASRLEALLRAASERGPLGLSELAGLQQDVVEPRGQELVESALALVESDPLGSEASEIAELLRAWDGAATRDSVGAAAYHAFLVSLTRELFVGPLGGPLLDRYLAVPQAEPGQVVFGIVRHAATGGERDGWSDPERVAPAVRKALRGAWFELSSRLGAGRHRWRWGRLHRLAFRPFTPARGVGDEELGPFDAAGSGATLETAEYAPLDPYGVRIASLFRFAVDAAALDGAQVALAPGQSEHAGHPAHAAGLGDWLDGRLVPLRDVPGREARLSLEPAP